MCAEKIQRPNGFGEGSVRILFYNRWVGFNIGGTETHIKELATRLSKRGHKVEILTTQGDALEHLKPSIKVSYVKRNARESPYPRSLSQDRTLIFHAGVFAFRSFLRLLSQLRSRVVYDVVSVHCTLEALVMRFVRRLFKIPFVFVFEGYTYMEGWAAAHADAQIAISRDIADRCQINHGYLPKVIHAGTNIKRFHSHPHDIATFRRQFAEDDEKLVLTVCQFFPRKNLPTLVRAARVVCDHFKKVQFILVGEGTEREKIARTIAELDLQEQVRIVAERPARDEYFEASDLFVLPSLYEGFGIVFLEAMTAGLPVIGSNIPAIREVLGDAGVLIDPLDHKELADRILELLNDREKCGELSARSLQRIKEFDWEKLIPEYEAVYESVIRKRRA